MRYIIFDTTTGRLGRALVSGNIADQIAASEGVIDDPNDSFTESTHYVAAGIVTSRPAMPVVTVDKNTLLADGVDKVTISGILQGAEIYVNGRMRATMDATGVLEYTTDLVGIQTIETKSWPQQTQRIELNGQGT